MNTWILYGKCSHEETPPFQHGSTVAGTKDFVVELSNGKRFHVELIVADETVVPLTGTRAVSA